MESPMTDQIRSPYDIPEHVMTDLAARWSQARTRNLMANAGLGEVDQEDLFAELAYGARIVQEATYGRWCVIAELLRLGAVDSWARIETAMGATKADVRDGFHAWVVAQR